MKSIVRDEAEFASYFWWKEHYEVRQDEKFMKKAFCDLCKKLHEDSEPKVKKSMKVRNMKKMQSFCLLAGLHRYGGLVDTQGKVQESQDKNVNQGSFFCL